MSRLEDIPPVSSILTPATALWCNGSTEGFGPSGPSSILGGAI